MQRSHKEWWLIGSLALVLTVTLAVGFGFAIHDVLYPEASTEFQQKEEVIKKDSNKIVITALGDSLTEGAQSSTGKGYVGELKGLLEPATGKQVNVVGNLAISGATTVDLLGRLDEVAYNIKTSDIIVMTIGGNDLFSFAREEVDTALIEQRIPDALERLGSIFATIHKLNPKAEVYYFGLYNPFEELANGQEASLLIQRWNNQAFQLLNQYPLMTFVPSYDLFERKLDTYLSSDEFHPNQAGYEKMAQRMVEVIQ